VECPQDAQTRERIRIVIRKTLAQRTKESGTVFWIGCRGDFLPGRMLGEEPARDARFPLGAVDGEGDESIIAHRGEVATHGGWVCRFIALALRGGCFRLAGGRV